MNNAKQEHSKARVVVDTSVLISAVLGSSHSAPRQILKYLLNGVFIAYSSEDALSEFYNVLFSKKVSRYFGNQISILSWTFLVVHNSVNLVQPKRKFHICRDPEDDEFLDIAYDAKAKYIITLDKDLLDLRDNNKEITLLEHKVRILTPREFLDLQENNTS